MKYHIVRRPVFSLLITFCIVGCATPQQAAPVSERSAAKNYCEFTDEQTTLIRSRAMKFLVTEWPVLDVQCEELAMSIRQRPTGECAVDGRPLVMDGCPVPSHRGYIIIINQQTLEPQQIYWIPAEN